MIYSEGTESGEEADDRDTGFSSHCRRRRGFEVRNDTELLTMLRKRGDRQFEQEIIMDSLVGYQIRQGILGLHIS
jgi:hypothetical protein